MHRQLSVVFFMFFFFIFAAWKTWDREHTVLLNSSRATHKLSLQTHPVTTGEAADDISDGLLEVAVGVAVGVVMTTAPPSGGRTCDCWNTRASLESTATSFSTLREGRRLG